MIKRTITGAINRFGTEGVITEYSSQNKHVVKGILQPLNNNIRRYSNTEYTNAGVIDNGNYLFIFDIPKTEINYRNATVWLYGSNYWFKECTVYYFNNKPLYMRGVLSPFEKE